MVAPREVGQGFVRVTARTTDAEKAIDGLGTKIAALGATAVLAGFARGAVEEASDLGESLNVTGLIFGVMLAGGLLIPNPFMPESVRWAHLWETSSSNLFLGILCIYILEGPAWSKKPILAQTD